MNYLVDTNVVSELRKGKRADPLVIDWFMRRRPQDVFLSVLTVGELRRGVRRIQRRDSKAASALGCGWTVFSTASGIVCWMSTWPSPSDGATWEFPILSRMWMD